MPVAEELIPVPVPRSLLADVHELIVKHERALEEEADEADFASTVVRWGVVRAADLNDLLSRQKAVVSGDGGPATGGHPHGERSAGRDEGALR